MNDFLYRVGQHLLAFIWFVGPLIALGVAVWVIYELAEAFQSYGP